MSNHNDNFKDWIEVFDNYYFELAGFKYQYTPKDFKNLKLLKAKVCAVDTTGNELDSFEAFLGSIDSDWYLENMSLPLLNSHFNQLLLKAKKNEQQSDYSKFFKNGRFQP